MKGLPVESSRWLWGELERIASGQQSGAGTGTVDSEYSEKVLLAVAYIEKTHLNISDCEVATKVRNLLRVTATRLTHCTFPVVVHPA